MSTAYNKLVRDRIPEIIESEGKTTEIQILSEEAFKIALVDKLQETAREYAADPNTNSLLDILELAHAIAGVKYNIPGQQLEEMRQQRRTERGGFEGRIMLVESSD